MKRRWIVQIHTDAVRMPIGIVSACRAITALGPNATARRSVRVDGREFNLYIFPTMPLPQAVRS